MLKDNQSSSDGEEIAKDLMMQLQVDPDCLIAGAYMDLLLAQHVEA